jgi:hypothetical protein
MMVRAIALLNSSERYTGEKQYGYANDLNDVADQFTL